MNDLQSATLGKLAAALVKAQATMGVAVKDTTGQIGQNKGYKYADLASVINAARDALALNDLAVIQRPQPSTNGVCLQTMIVHSSGEWIADGGLTLPAAKIDAQGYGSAMTYARRYGLAAMLGIVQDDDDGARAVASQQAARENAVKIANAPKLTESQRECITAIMAAAGHASPNLDDKLEEDYEQHVEAAVRYGVKQKVIEAGDAPDVVAAALEGSLAKVQFNLGGVPA